MRWPWLGRGAILCLLSAATGGVADAAPTASFRDVERADRAPTVRARAVDSMAGALVVGDLLGRSLGAEAFGGFRVNGVGVSARVRLGAQLGLGLVAAYYLDLRFAEPFAGLRADFYTGGGATNLGGGLVLGLQVPVWSGLGITAQASFEAFTGSTQNRALATVGSAGIYWRD